MVNLLKKWSEKLYCWFLDFKKYDRATIREIIDKETGMFEALNWPSCREISECTCEWFESEDPDVIGCICPPNKLVYEFTKEQYYEELLRCLPFMWVKTKHKYNYRYNAHAGKGQLRTYLREQRELWDKSKTWPDASKLPTAEQDKRDNFFFTLKTKDPDFTRLMKETDERRELRLFFKE